MGGFAPKVALVANVAVDLATTGNVELEADQNNRGGLTMARRSCKYGRRKDGKCRKRAKR